MNNLFPRFLIVGLISLAFTTVIAQETEPSIHWMNLDKNIDRYPGISVERAYEGLLKGKEGKAVVVAVIDSGVDVEHEDLKESIWVNEDEIPDNGIDDDQNGYVDDVHGWNFIGDMTGATFELTRILKKGDDGSEEYQKAKGERERKLSQASAQKKQVN